MQLQKHTEHAVKCQDRSSSISRPVDLSSDVSVGSCVWRSHIPCLLLREPVLILIMLLRVLSFDLLLSLKHSGRKIKDTLWLLRAVWDQSYRVTVRTRSSAFYCLTAAEHVAEEQTHCPWVWREKTRCPDRSLWEDDQRYKQTFKAALDAELISGQCVCEDLTMATNNVFTWSFKKTKCIESMCPIRVQKSTNSIIQIFVSGWIRNYIREENL